MFNWVARPHGFAIGVRTALPFALAAIMLMMHEPVQAQREFRVYPGFEGAESDAPLPADWNVPEEIVIGRLMYPGGRMRWRGGGDWRQGYTSWTDDYPRGDRTLVQMLRRYTTIHVRAVEQPVNLEDKDDAFYWPIMIVGLAQPWQLTDEMAVKLRDYMLRGGFLFCDSFFDSRSWVIFNRSLRKVFPDRQVIEVPDDHPIFHNVFDLPHMSTVQIPNWNSLRWGGGGYLGDGAVPHWRGVADDNGRLMMLIAFNNDVADGWQWADDPDYPSEEANLSLKIGVNVVVYALTH